MRIGLLQFIVGYSRERTNTHALLHRGDIYGLVLPGQPHLGDRRHVV